MKKLRFGLCFFLLIDKRMLASNNRGEVVDLYYVSLAKLGMNFPEFPAYLLPG